MNNHIFRIMLIGVIILNMFGFLMDVAWIQRTGAPGFFGFNLAYRIHLSYWLFANIVFLSVTMITSFFFTGAQFHITSDSGNNNGNLSIKLLVINLILIPTLLASFLLVSSDKLTREKLMNALLNKRVVYLEGDITHAEAERIGRAIMLLNAQDNSREITIYINSNGGSVLAGLNIYDAIKHSKAPVTGVVSKSAASMAVVALQACKTRRALKHSHMFIHNLKITDEWHKFEENLEEELDDVKVLQQNINGLLAEQSGLHVEEIQKLSRNGKVLQPEEAKELGLIDEVI